MIRSHPRKERSYSMTDEAAFFHQVRALVHQSRTILAPSLCGDHTFDMTAHELAPVIRAFLQPPAPARVPEPEPLPAPLWRRLTMGRLSFKRRAPPDTSPPSDLRSEEHTSELQSQSNLVCRLLLEKKKNT